MWNNPPLNILFENKFTINDTILNESHNRCARAGLPRSAQKPVLMRDQNYLPSTLIAVKKYADLLFVDTRGNISNSNYIFMFSDHDGYILNIHANQDVFVNVLNPYELSVGACLKEESFGTNAISLAVYHKESIVLKGQQHYCNLFHDWSCVATPVLSINNELIGCVGIFCDMSTDVGDRLALTCFLAKILANFCIDNATTSSMIPLSDTQKTLQAICPTYRETNLSSRQKEVLIFFSEGLSYKEIAQHLGLTSHKTVEAHLDAIREKFSVSTRRECIKKAMKLGLLDT